MDKARKQTTTPESKRAKAIASAITHGPDIDALADAFDRFATELDASTIPIDGGRKVHTIVGADRLSRLSAGLSSMLAMAVRAGIGDGLPVDEHMFGAFESASRLLALTPKQHNERRPRFAFEDVLTHEQVESLHAARRMLALRRTDAPAAFGVTPDHERVLEAWRGREDKRLKALDVASMAAVGIRNRETIGLLMNELADAGYLDWPKTAVGNRKRKGAMPTSKGSKHLATFDIARQ